MQFPFPPVNLESGVPLANQVESTLRIAIGRGWLRPNDRLPAVRELSEGLHVSKSTVANAIARMVKSNLLVARQGCGVFVANTTPESATGISLGNLAVYWDGNLSFLDQEWYYLDIYQSLVNAASRYNSHLLTLPGSGHALPVMERIAALRQNSSLVGVLYLVISSVDRELARNICQCGLPLVLVDDIDDSINTTGIMLDNAGGIAEAMNALLGMKHRRIAYINCVSDCPSASERLAAYSDALEQAGVPYNPRLIERVRPGVNGGREALARLLPEQPSAIITFNPLLAEGVMLEARERGISIPDDLSLIAFGASMRRTEPGAPSSVVFDPQEMADAALDAIIKRIRGEENSSCRRSVRTFLRDGGTIAPPSRRVSE